MKSSDANATTMDSGNKGGQIEQFDPSNQPKAMQKWERWWLPWAENWKITIYIYIYINVWGITKKWMLHWWCFAHLLQRKGFCKTVEINSMCKVWETMMNDIVIVPQYLEIDMPLVYYVPFNLYFIVFIYFF